jgi:hypothetical protein
MRFELNIDYHVEKMAMSRRRLEARPRFTYADRVPVMYCLAPRYFTPLESFRAIMQAAEECGLGNGQALSEWRRPRAPSFQRAL